MLFASFCLEIAQTENDATEGNLILGETLHVLQPRLTLPREPPRDKSGSLSLAASYGLPETSAQMCCNSSRNSTTHKTGPAPAQQRGSQHAGRAPRARDALGRMVIAGLPERCQNTTALWSKTFPSRPPEILEYAMDLWARLSPARAGPLAMAQGSGSVPPTVLCAALHSYLHLLCLDSPKCRRKLISFQSPRV